MSYLAAIEGLQALAGELAAGPGVARRKFRLEDMRVLLGELGDPQLRFPSVLIAGTNGKGSTASTLASILAAAGYRTGLYTSPHLSRVNERIRILPSGEQEAGPAKSREDSACGNGEISDNDFAGLYFRVDEAASHLVREGRLPDHSSFFETVTALAFLHFAAEGVDIAVLEVGMGGRLDATNVVEPLVSVITDISLDHTDWLGKTIDAITREKAGILRRGGIMVTLPQHPEANQALGEIAVELGVSGVNAAEYIPTANDEAGAGAENEGNRYRLRTTGANIEIDSPLAGRHQQRNIALAIATVTELRNRFSYNIAPEHIAQGIRTTRWPGRLERFTRAGRADVLLDVAHNPAGAWALRAGISALAGDDATRPLTLIFGCLRDKALQEMAQILFPIFDRVLVTEVDSPRTALSDDLKAAAEKTGAETEASSGARAALKRAYELTPAGGLIVAAGSVYLVGRIREALAEDSC